jgi:hypothetical protein
VITSASSINGSKTVCLLSVVLAAVSGCFAGLAADAGFGEAKAIVELPPVLVTDRNGGGKPWRYVATPGHEILSRCSDEVLADFAERAMRLEDLFAVVLPRQFQFQTSVPKVTILTTPQDVSANARDVIMGLDEKERAKRKVDEPSIRFLPNLALDDVDAISLFAIIDEQRADPTALVYTRLHVQFMLERCTPTPPTWFVAGMLRLFDDLEFRDRDIVVRPLTWPAVDGDSPRVRSDYTPKIGLADMFAGARAARSANSSSSAAQLAAEAALLIRWALDTNESSQRQGFWKLVSRSTHEPVDDAIVKETLGFGLIELHRRLSEYLPTAMKTRFRLHADKLTPLPKLEIEDATPVQIGRIIGDWNRLEAKYVGTSHPEFAPLYFNLAQHAIDEGRRSEPNDPALCAVAGLLQSDEKNEVMAQPFLQLAADAKIVRPRVYLDLAWLHYRQALEHPAGSESRLSGMQANSILILLATAHQQQPPIVGVYVLAAEVWNHSQAELEPNNFAMLEHAIEQFPDDVRLLYLVALLEANHGSRDKAEAYVDHGLQVSRTEAIRARFQQLKETLAVKDPH